MLPASGSGYVAAVRRLWIIVVAAGLTLVGGCGGGVADKRDAAAGVARSFYGALEHGDGTAACSALAPETRHKLEQSEGEACPEAVLSLHLAAGSVRTVDAYGREARISLDDDTAFASKMPDGWRIIAAGCKERSKLPYDCQLEK